MPSPEIHFNRSEYDHWLAKSRLAIDASVVDVIVVLDLPNMVRLTGSWMNDRGFENTGSIVTGAIRPDHLAHVPRLHCQED